MFISISLHAFAQQDMQDVVYLKNGSVIRGTTIEQVPNEYIKIETSDLNVFVYKTNEIEKITKEPSKILKNNAYGNMNSKNNQLYDKKFYFGFSLGANLGMWTNASLFMSDLNNELLATGIHVSLEKHPLFGINLGLSFGYKINKWLHLQPEINFLNKGQCFSGDGYVDASSTQAKIFLREKIFINYIQIPVVVKFVSKPGFYLSVGPGIEITTHSTIVAYARSQWDSDSQRQLVKGQTKPLNVGVLAGVGFQKRWFGIEVRYLYDFLDSYKPEADDHHIKNQLVQFSLYFYPGKK